MSNIFSWYKTCPITKDRYYSKKRIEKLVPIQTNVYMHIRIEKEHFASIKGTTMKSNQMKQRQFN